MPDEESSNADFTKQKQVYNSNKMMDLANTLLEMKSLTAYFK